MVSNARKTELLIKINHMPERTTQQKARKANALKHWNNMDNDDGACGRIEDILAKSVNSTICNFSKQGQADCFVWVDGKRYKAERKTNGGRVGELYGKKPPKFVVYSMDVCNSGTGQLRRVIAPIVMTTIQFKAILEDCNALKSTNGKNPEIAIQVTSKALFIALSDYTLTYDPARQYTTEDFGAEA
jgi:hypothetical protein